MHDRAWRVAVIDSGIDAAAAGAMQPREARRFVDRDGEVIELEPTVDPTGHGTQIAAILSSADRAIELVAAQVTSSKGCCTPAAVAAGIRWALSRNADLIHLSLGLRHDRPVLGRAIAAAVAAGILVVASTPARGAVCYPAAYPGVIRATGDARCRRDEIALLASQYADFGACAVHVSTHGRSLRGASIGAAHLSRFIASNLTPASGLAVRARLCGLAVHHGPERRLA